MEYLYALDNANLTLRVVEFLRYDDTLPLDTVTVLHRREGWILCVRFKWLPHPQQMRDLQAVMLEFGRSYQPSPLIEEVLHRLAIGQPLLEIMQIYQFRVAVVSHGQPTPLEIESFREQFIQGLGYCPPSLA